MSDNFASVNERESRHIKDISESNYTFIEYGGNDCDFDWMKIADAPAEDYAPKTSLEDFRVRFISSYFIG